VGEVTGTGSRAGAFNCPLLVPAAAGTFGCWGLNGVAGRTIGGATGPGVTGTKGDGAGSVSGSGCGSTWGTVDGSGRGSGAGAVLLGGSWVGSIAGRTKPLGSPRFDVGKLKGYGFGPAQLKTIGRVYDTIPKLVVSTGRTLSDS